MARVRVSTTVDEALLARARGARAGSTDAALLDEALQALLAHHRAGELDASYAAYDQHPLDEPDEWGDPIGRRSAVNLDSVESVSVAVLVERLGRLSDDRMREVCSALEVAVDCTA
jgi:hypothetical protein